MAGRLIPNFSLRRPRHRGAIAKPAVSTRFGCFHRLPHTSEAGFFEGKPI